MCLLHLHAVLLLISGRQHSLLQWRKFHRSDHVTIVSCHAINYECFPVAGSLQAHIASNAKVSAHDARCDLRCSLENDCTPKSQLPLQVVTQSFNINGACWVLRVSTASITSMIAGRAIGDCLQSDTGHTSLALGGIMGWVNALPHAYCHCRQHLH